MKLSVRSKVANGLVICLLIPRVASTAVEMFKAAEEGLNDFAADDGFTLKSERNSFAVMEFQAQPSGDPSVLSRGGPSDYGNDPTAGGTDPTAHGPPPGAGSDPSASLDPSACDDPSGGPPRLIVQAPELLVTAECDPSGVGVDPSGSWDPSGCSQYGSFDHFQVSMYPAPNSPLVYAIASNDETEAIPVAEEVIFDEFACFPQTIWVAGQNDGWVDGDQGYVIEVYNDDQQDSVAIPGKNLDDDNYVGVNLVIEEPVQNKDGSYKVLVDVEAESPVLGGQLVISVTPKLAIRSYSLVVPGPDPGESIKPHELVFSDIGLDSGELLTLELGIVRMGGGPQEQKIFASFMQPDEGLMNGDDKNIPPPSP